MTTVSAEYAAFPDISELKSILTSPGPCVSIYLPLSEAERGERVDALVWKDTLLRSVAQSTPKEIAESLEDWASLRSGLSPRARAAAVFRSGRVFRIVSLHRQVAAQARVGAHFYIQPLLREATGEPVFYLLALSQSNIRLLRCTPEEAQEVPWKTPIASNFEQYMDSAKPDHVSIKRATAGVSAGSSKGATGTFNTERETKDEYLQHFFKQVDRGVHEVLNGSKEPLVLAGVEYEVALYRRVNSYPHLIEEYVQGAPNSLKSGEMHARALEVLDREYERQVDAVLAEFNHKAGGGATNRLEEVTAAVKEGRVNTLLVSEDAALADKTNEIAIEAILHAGRVLVAPPEKMPDNAPAAAIYRF